MEPSGPAPDQETPEQTARTWNVAYVAVRVLALYLAAQGLITLGNQTEFLFSQFPDNWHFLLGSLGLILAGIIAWFLAPAVADRVWIGAMPSEPALRTPVADLQRIAFQVVGLLLMLEALPRILTSFGDLIIRRRQAPEFLPQPTLFTEYDVLSIVIGFILMGFGFFLLLGADRLSIALDRFRNRHIDRLRQMEHGRPPQKKAEGPSNSAQ